MTSEDVLRLEYKLDLIINALQASNLMLATEHLPQMQHQRMDACPACGQDIKILPNYSAEILTRKCGCFSGFSVVPGIGKLSIPPSGDTNASVRRETENQLPPDYAEEGPSVSGCSTPTSAGS